MVQAIKMGKEGLVYFEQRELWPRFARVEEALRSFLTPDGIREQRDGMEVVRRIGRGERIINFTYKGFVNSIFLEIKGYAIRDKQFFPLPGEGVGLRPVEDIYLEGYFNQGDKKGAVSANFRNGEVIIAAYWLHSVWYDPHVPNNVLHGLQLEQVVNSKGKVFNVRPSAPENNTEITIPGTNNTFPYRRDYLLH